MLTHEEMQEHYHEYCNDMKRDMLQKYQKEINDFIEFLATKDVSVSKDNFDYIQTVGIIIEYPNILQIVEPNFIQDKNKEELLVKWKDIDSLFSLNVGSSNAGYIYSENYIAMASHLFRRGFSHVNNWSPRFIDLFWEVNKQNIDAYIALDFDRLRINVDDLPCMERDTWFGPLFSNDIEQIEDGTTKLIPPKDIEKHIVSFCFADAYALDVFWYTNKNIKTFQAMEFKSDSITIEYNDIKYHPVRYVHAEYDVEKKNFRHFDGAIQYLTPDEYSARRDTDFNHNDKAIEQIKPFSKKLFKFNGDISIETWKELTCQFFASNPLVYEYFSGELPENVKNTIEKARNSRNKEPLL